MGEIIRVAGSLVEARGMENASMYELVKVGEEELLGEVISLDSGVASIQVYEETSGIKPGEPAKETGESLSVQVGPGLLGSIYDGVQRPLEKIKEQEGDFIARGAAPDALDKEKKWEFVSQVEEGDKVGPGDIVGYVEETETIKHKIMVPPDVEGEVKEITEGEVKITDTVVVLKDGREKHEVKPLRTWPVRKPRPCKENLSPKVPLITGQRVLDTLFPLAKGGSAAIPGGFGTGKTVTQHQLSKWADADIIVYVGCGERGNEMAEVLEEFPELEDPRTGKPLMERTILIANTSNMPVAAREASVYTGITLAEYYRDMGYDVALMADSTSRWAEAMREISSRLEEIPGEEGYPAYLASRLSRFYERSGRVVALGDDDRKGSVSVIGAVSPPGGDFSEPVTQNTLKIVRVFWALDTSLADRRHFPAIDWLTSYSLYKDQTSEWFEEEVEEGWNSIRSECMGILQKESDLQEIVKLVGPDALPDSDRIILEVARMIREDFLQQNAFHDVDTYCPLDKQYKMLEIILDFYEHAEASLEEMAIEEISELEVVDRIARMKNLPEEKFDKECKKIKKSIRKNLEG